MSEQDRPFRWEDLDQRLIKPELQLLTDKMQKRAVDGERRIALESSSSGNAGSYVPLFFDFHEQLADEWAQGLYTLYCAAPNQQNRSVAPGFIRAVWDRVIFPFIGVRTATVLGELSRQIARTHQVQNPVAEGEWVRRMRRFATRWRDKLEAEAVSSEYCTSQEIAQRAAADLLHLPKGLRHTGDPIEGNPFTVDNPRREVWDDATHEAEEQWYRLPSESGPAPTGPPNVLIAYVCERTAKGFDIWARRRVRVVWTEKDFCDYADWLVVYAEAWLQDLNARNPWREFVSATDLLPQLRLILTQRVGWWKAEARRYLAEQKAHLAKYDQPQSKTKVGDSIKVQTEPKPYRSVLKRFIQTQILLHPDATALQICRAIDDHADGDLELPESLKGKSQDRLFVDAYRDKKRRSKIDVMISKVRRDLRRLKVLPPH